MTATPTEPGTPVHVDYRKWDGSPHWQNDAHLLGVDEYGVWLGASPGTHYERTGASFDVSTSVVSLFPAAGFTPSFYDQHALDRVLVYVDITTTPQWSQDDDGSWRVTMVDLDLDVVQRVGGVVYVDDEDEFAEHATLFGYPNEIVRQAEADARRVFALLRDGEGPFGPVSAAWLSRQADTV